MKVTRESKTFHMDLQDSLDFNTIEDMLQTQSRVMESDGWYLAKVDKLNDGQVYEVTYERSFW